MNDEIEKEFKKHKKIVETQDKEEESIKKRIKLVETEVEVLKQQVNIQKSEETKSLSDLRYFLEKSIKIVAGQLKLIIKVQTDHSESLKCIIRSLNVNTETNESITTVSDENLKFSNSIENDITEFDEENSLTRSFTCPASTATHPEP